MILSITLLQQGEGGMLGRNPWTSGTAMYGQIAPYTAISCSMIFLGSTLQMVLRVATMLRWKQTTTPITKMILRIQACMAMWLTITPKTRNMPFGI